jgi:hypothetical protein
MAEIAKGAQEIATFAHQSDVATQQALKVAEDMLLLKNNQLLLKKYQKQWLNRLRHFRRQSRLLRIFQS